MPPKSTRCWKTLWSSWREPVVELYQQDLEGRISRSSSFEIVNSDETTTTLRSQRIISESLTLMALAPVSAHKQILQVELGNDDRTEEHDLDIAIRELSALGITVHKIMGDKQNTVWKVRTSSDTAIKPAWRYRYPRKPVEVVIPSNPNINKDTGPLRKTRRTVRRKFERTMIIGRSEITNWKRGAGRSKSWRKYREFHHNEARSEEVAKEATSENSPDISTTMHWPVSTPTVPYAFLCAQGRKPVQGGRKHRSLQKALLADESVVPYLNQFQKVKLADRRRGNPDVGVWRRRGYRHIAAWRRHFSIAWRPRQLRRTTQRVVRSAPDTTPKEKTEIHADFFRLIVGVGGKTEVVPEQYLTGLVVLPLTRREADARLRRLPLFSVSGFLRHESHADVYTLKHCDDSSGVYEGYLFFDEQMLSNWGKYGKRKVERLRRSRTYIGETKKKDRILVVVAMRPDATLGIKRTVADFPPLIKSKPGVDSGTLYSCGSNCSSDRTYLRHPESSPAKRHPKKRKRPSYAAIATKANATNPNEGEKHPSNHKAYQAWENRVKLREDSTVAKSKTESALLNRPCGDLQQLEQERSPFASPNFFTLLSV
jgi:hypothetical protein